MKCPDTPKRCWDGAKQRHIQGSSALKRCKRDPNGGRALFPPQTDTRAPGSSTELVWGSEGSARLDFKLQERFICSWKLCRDQAAGKQGRNRAWVKLGKSQKHLKRFPHLRVAARHGEPPQEASRAVDWS